MHVCLLCYWREFFYRYVFCSKKKIWKQQWISHCKVLYTMYFLKKNLKWWENEEHWCYWYQHRIRPPVRESDTYSHDLWQIIKFVSRSLFRCFNSRQLHFFFTLKTSINRIKFVSWVNMASENVDRMTASWCWFWTVFLL